MEIDTFWELIQLSKDKYPTRRKKQLEFLKKELHNLNKEELISFDKIFFELFKKSHSCPVYFLIKSASYNSSFLKIVKL